MVSAYIIDEKGKYENKECKPIKENDRWRIDAKIYFSDGAHDPCNWRWCATKADTKAFFNDWETKAFGEHGQTEDIERAKKIYRFRKNVPTLSPRKKKTPIKRGFFAIGADWGNRTSNLRFTIPLLCQLS